MYFLTVLVWNPPSVRPQVMRRPTSKSLTMRQSVISKHGFLGARERRGGVQGALAASALRPSSVHFYQVSLVKCVRIRCIAKVFFLCGGVFLLM